MNFVQTKTYIETIALAHVQVKSFRYGGLQRILTREIGVGQDYPMVWMEKPSFNFEGNSANIQAKPRFAITVLTNTDATGDEVGQDTAEELTFQILMDIIGKMYQDYKDATIVWFSPIGATIDPIDTITLDADIGWRFEFSLSDPIDVCYHADKFTPPEEPAP